MEVIQPRTPYVYKGKPKPIRVFGWVGQRSEARERYENGRMGHGQTREIVAAKTKAEMMKITGMTRTSFNNLVSETGNAEEIEKANSKPGTVFWQPLNALPGAEWHEA
jgi:hypothetical protein